MPKSFKYCNCMCTEIDYDHLHPPCLIEVRLPPYLGQPMRVIEVNMVLCRDGGREKREIPEKTRRQAASSCTIPTCESPVTQPGIEPVGGERANRSATAAPVFISVYPVLLPSEDRKGDSNTRTTCLVASTHKALGVQSPHQQLASVRLFSDTLSFFVVTLKRTDNFVHCVVAEQLACTPPTKAIRVQSPAGSLRIFAYGDRAGRCCCSAGFLGDLPFPPPFHSGASPYSPQSTSSALKTSMLRAVQIFSLIVHSCIASSCYFDTQTVNMSARFYCQHKKRLSKPLAWNAATLIDWLSRLERSSASRQREPGSIPGGVAPGFLHLGIVPDDAIGRRVFSGIPRFPHPFFPALLNTHLATTSSALKTSRSLHSLSQYQIAIRGLRLIQTEREKKLSARLEAFQGEGFTGMRSAKEKSGQPASVVARGGGPRGASWSGESGSAASGRDPAFGAGSVDIATARGNSALPPSTAHAPLPTAHSAYLLLELRYKTSRTLETHFLSTLKWPKTAFSKRPISKYTLEVHTKLLKGFALNLPTDFPPIK
ncbi:hypothetical protein PR048_028969 [Dryococelus australis]|uniref:Uncharacterized protein n=1 Tax=Dryococelus australis TaxID=614101 RepID=A0ABQ9GCG6_9NEOP|nr:hypothetical protein PR048_028969 [Dryococelus australis]